MKCNHEWRLFGTRIEERGWHPIRNKNIGVGRVKCTKCGIENSAEYEVIKKCPIPTNIDQCFLDCDDIIVKIINWTVFYSTVIGCSLITKKTCILSEYKWDEKEEQWVCIYPITIWDYFRTIKNMIL